MGDVGVVLLAEDHADDAHLVREAFKRASIPAALHTVTDGEEAIAYLSGTGAYANREEHPLPDIILLDLKMPKVEGFEVLKWVRRQPGLRKCL